MATTLRQVLEYFEQHHGTISLPELARQLGIERSMLEPMLEFWVRKGKLRDTSAPACVTCGSAEGCPFVVTLPHRYELVTEGSTGTVSAPACNCEPKGCH
ncbi:MAG: FeoC-like transcriptional regulator [Anaerolineae bacterium]